MKFLITKPSPPLSIKSYPPVANGFLMTHSKTKDIMNLSWLTLALLSCITLWIRTILTKSPIQNALSKELLNRPNGQALPRWRILQSTLFQRVIPIMITECHDIGHSSIGHLITHGSLLFIQTVKKIFQYDSMNGGIPTDLQRTFYRLQYSKGSIFTYSKPKDYTMWRQSNSTKNSRSHGFSAGVTKLPNTTVLQINFQWASSESSKLNGGTNSIKRYVLISQLLNSSAQAKNSNIKFNRLLRRQILPSLQNLLIKLR